MNESILAQEAAVLQPHTAAGEYFYSRYQSSGYWAGFMAYCRGLSLDTLHTDAERAGWWRANKAQAAAEMPVTVDDADRNEDVSYERSRARHHRHVRGGL